MNQLKIAMHIHSSWSYDAQTPIADLVPIFRRLGANVMLMTEHDRGLDQSIYKDFCEDCSENSSDDMLVVPGIEYSSPDNAVHILTWGLKEFLAEGLPVSAILTEVMEQKGIAVFAHPRRRDVWKSFDHSWAEKLNGIEIWNRKADGFAPFDVAIDMALKMNLTPTVGVDYHTHRQLFPLLNVSPRSTNGKPTEIEVLDAIRHRALTLYACGIPVSREEDIIERRVRLFRAIEMARRSAVSMRKLIARRSSGVENID